MENKSTINKQESNPTVMHSFKETNAAISPKKVLIIFLALFALGAGTGYGLNSYSSGTDGNTENISKKDASTEGKTFGSEDTDTFSDTTEGVVREGGINGEGKFHLERPGGESQNVYMISSTVDLSKFIGKEIKVWGQTIDAETAGWLMDVGRIEVL
jgi:hypothetical protein